MKIETYPSILVKIVQNILEEQDEKFIEKIREEDEKALEEVYGHNLIDEYQTPYMYELTDKEYAHFSDKLMEDVIDIAISLVR